LAKQTRSVATVSASKILTEIVGLCSHGRMNAKRQLHLIACAALSSLALVCTTRAGDTRPADETKLRELEVAMSAAAEAKNLDKVVSYYADDAAVFAPNTAAATTKEAIRSVWKAVFAPAASSGGWKAARVEVAKSGDLAYTSGTYDGATMGADGKSAKDSGNYLTVWKKQADGTWKILVDTWATDLPAAAAKS